MSNINDKQKKIQGKVFFYDISIIILRQKDFDFNPKFLTHS